MRVDVGFTPEEAVSAPVAVVVDVVCAINLQALAAAAQERHDTGMIGPAAEIRAL